MLGIRPAQPSHQAFVGTLLTQVSNEGSVDPGARSSSLASDAESSENGEDYISALPEIKENKITRKHTSFRERLSFKRKEPTTPVMRRSATGHGPHTPTKQQKSKPVMV